jgi:hypothetical protein
MFDLLIAPTRRHTQVHVDNLAPVIVGPHKLELAIGTLVQFEVSVLLSDVSFQNILA